MSTFRFLHAADIHLDSPLAGLTRAGAVPAHVTHECTRRAFSKLIDLAITEDVAFVIIAGDLYDADQRDFNTALFFAREMQRLAGRPCFLLRGNHDAASVITRSLEAPPNVRLFPANRPKTFHLDDHAVAIHGQSFPHRAVPEDLSENYPRAEEGKLNIGVLHTSADDPGEHATYAPCDVSALVQKGYDYWALGHIHQRRVLHDKPFVVFPGNIQGRHARETGAKGCTLVEVRDRAIVSATPRATDVLRWAHIRVDVAGAETVAEIGARVRFELATALTASDGLPLIARLTLSGATSRHRTIVADPEAIAAECRAAAAATGADLYVERVRAETRPTEAGAHFDAGSIDQLAGNFRAALDDPDIRARLFQEFRSLAGQIPKLPGQAGFAPPDVPADLLALGDDAWQIVADALAAKEIT